MTTVFQDPQATTGAGLRDNRVITDASGLQRDKTAIITTDLGNRTFLLNQNNNPFYGQYRRIVHRDDSGIYVTYQDTVTGQTLRLADPRTSPSRTRYYLDRTKNLQDQVNNMENSNTRDFGVPRLDANGIAYLPAENVRFRFVTDGDQYITQRITTTTISGDNSYLYNDDGSSFQGQVRRTVSYNPSTGKFTVQYVDTLSNQELRNSNNQYSFDSENAVNTNEQMTSYNVALNDYVTEALARGETLEYADPATGSYPPEGFRGGNMEFNKSLAQHGIQRNQNQQEEEDNGDVDDDTPFDESKTRTRHEVPFKQKADAANYRYDQPPEWWAQGESEEVRNSSWNSHLFTNGYTREDEQKDIENDRKEADNAANDDTPDDTPDEPDVPVDNGDDEPDVVEDKVDEIEAKVQKKVKAVKTRVKNVKDEIEDVVEEIEDVFQAIKGKVTKSKLNSLTKDQLVKAAKTDHGVELDGSVKKSTLVNKVYSLYNKK